MDEKRQISSSEREPKDLLLGRRTFLKVLGGAAVGTFAALDVLSFAEILRTDGPYALLVVGDSLIWGQGLREQDKSYTLFANWLRTDAFGKPREVSLKVKAHSSATLKFDADYAEKYKRIGRQENFYYQPELNISTPSISGQLDAAASEYKAAGNNDGADLIVISGGAPDITVASILDPSGDDKKLSEDIERYCHREMLDVLRYAAALNPSAVTAVVGYYPLITPKTSSSKLLNAWLELRSFPRIFKPLLNNPVVRPLYFKKLRKRAQKRSTIWVQESSHSLRTAVQDLNKELGAKRAVFVPSPIGDDAAFETPNSLLFRLRHNHSDDPLFADRKAQCSADLPKLKKEADIAIPRRYCENAAIGHPSAAGAKIYFEAIQTATRPFLTASRV